ncbi:hypothetical protein ZWY2020_015350 [Hordeum vulgare]|nr:hypothetical protein ZWY2020_015350 [Hordeum vulgare]
MVFSGDPSSSCCILAATTGACKLALCRVGCPDHGWTTARCTTTRYKELVDISFCNGGGLDNNGLPPDGKLLLYGISHSDQLLKFEVTVNVDGGAPSILRTHLIAGLEAGIPRAAGATCHPQHIFELHGEVAIAVEQTGVRGEASYLVCELAAAAGDERTRYTMLEVTSLDDHALFLSPACSKLVHASDAAGARGRVYRNCIYHPKGHASPFHGERCMKRLDLGGSSVVYSSHKDCVHYLARRIMSKVYHYRCNSKDGGSGFTWFLPRDF